MAKCCILELGVCVDHKIRVTNNSEVSTSGGELDVLCECLTNSQVFHVLRLHLLTVFGLFVSPGEKLEVESLDLILFHPDNLTV